MERFSWLQGKEKRDCESLMLCEAVTAIWVGGREEGLWVVATRKRETDKTAREKAEASRIEIKFESICFMSYSYWSRASPQFSDLLKSTSSVSALVLRTFAATPIVALHSLVEFLLVSVRFGPNFNSPVPS